MKKLFTLIFALVGLSASVSAASIDDVLVCKHSYSLLMDEVTGTSASSKGAKPGKGQLFGDGFFLDVTGGSVANNKQQADPAATNEDGTYKYGEAFATKYAALGSHYNCFRLKNAQDVFAMKVTAGSKVIILGQVHASRYPKIATNAALTEGVQSNTVNTVATDGYFSWTAPDDMTIYVGSQGGDYYIGMVIVEANEAAGTPSVKVGEQKFDNGLFYREVTCKPNTYDMYGEVFNTIVTYTTDGTAPTAESPIYKEPIKCYKDMNVKFQAFVDYGDGAVGDICEGADNEGIVSFSFDAPAISFDEATKTATFSTPYEAQGANVKYIYSYNDVNGEGGSAVLSTSAEVSVYYEVTNGTYGTFTSKSASQDCYILDAIKEPTTISVTAGNAVIDEEATAAQGSNVYVIENGAISAKENQFFVKDLEFAAIANGTDNAKYQVPAGQEAYIKMNNTNITFKLDEPAKVVVTCSKNACKNIESETATDRQCKVNVDGTVYGNEDILEENGNIIEFELEAGFHTFQKFSGTGNILISSIEVIVPKPTGIAGVAEAAEASNGVVKAVKNGQIVIVKNGAEYTVSGAQIK